MAEPIDDGYPIVVRLAGRRVVVVGGGSVALRKVRGLLAADADVVVISPAIVAELRDLEGITVVERRYEAGDCAGAWLVIAATDDPDAQQLIADDAERHGIFVNSVDDPDRCSFILPAVERRGPVIVAVSTQGRSPALAAQLRDQLAAALPERVGELAEEISAQRRELHDAGRSTEAVDWTRSFAEFAAARVVDAGSSVS